MSIPGVQPVHPWDALMLLPLPKCLVCAMEEAFLSMSSGGSGSTGLCVAVSPWHWLGACYCVLGWHPAGTGPAFCPPCVQSRHHPCSVWAQPGDDGTAHLAVARPQKESGVVQPNLAGGGNLAWDPASCWLCTLSLAGRENSTPARLRLGCPCLQEGMETDGAVWSGCEQLY